MSIDEEVYVVRRSGDMCAWAGRGDLCCVINISPLMIC